MDPDKFFEVEDKKRKAGLEERKQSNDDRQTNAYIGLLKSKSVLAEANADKADRAGAGGLRPSRSSEAQINTAIARRDKSFDRVSSVKDEETGKFEVDPQRRQALDSASNQYQDFLEEQLGEELDARQHHKFTDAMVTYPVGGSAADIKRWQEKELLPRFGVRVPKESSAPGLAPNTQTASRAGTLAAVKKDPTQVEKELEAVKFNATDRQRMRELQIERTATNLSPAEREENTRQINALIAKNASKSTLK
jgi:hypothetical protein